LVLSDVDNSFFDRENSSKNTPHDESKSGTAIKEPSRSKPLSDPLWVSYTYAGVYTPNVCVLTPSQGRKVMSPHPRVISPLTNRINPTRTALSNVSDRDSTVS
jgi:hypothetical protein